MFKPMKLNQSGQGLTEYIILLMLIAVFSIGVVKKLGGTVKNKLDQAEGKIQSDVNWQDR